jgi:F-type H+-transporting ATPase subunit delta
VPEHIEKMTDSLDRIYGRALLELADQAGTLDEIAAEVSQLGLVMEEHEQLRKLLSSRIISEKERAGVIERVFAGRISDLLYRFLQVVNHKSRLGELPGILQAYTELLAVKRGLVDVDLYVVEPLTEDQARRVSEAIAAVLEGKQVVLRQHAAPHLLGGARIRIGDKLFDGSVATQLKLLREQLISTGREKARTLSAIND